MFTLPDYPTRRQTDIAPSLAVPARPASSPFLLGRASAYALLTASFALARGLGRPDRPTQRRY
ncbi:hypothetical protein [Crenobacter luteus]|uniref:Uncharacterized protein n=1 Tax=Crenobacter luteus TaxID=1452487 RepID=A0A161SF65_9NEIS|nr:hypothetical protein [Crenobacter luteus]KZE35253.1 hypothetical protein AVW16_04350 [Crenobacter luteus]